LHGIFRTRHSLEYLAKGFREAGYEAIPIDYASCHLPIERHAENLRALVAELKEAEEIAFVCHSMGGLVTRTYLANGPDPRIKRVVMFGPPIYGSEKADFFQDWGLFNYLFGPSGRQLTTSRLPPAPLPARIEIGVIAGGTGKEKGYSMLLPGDNDGTVTVASTRLAGAHDFVVTPSRHTFMIASAKNRELALRFVREGSFQGEENRRPIPASGVPEGRTERGPEPRRDGAAKTTTEG
ncbi:MAG TPA: hypothetical protein VNC50_04610, partial [Planctomycetia bacterium]|nr:hypothetical protein [Planctomycetia bacterium]